MHPCVLFKTFHYNRILNSNQGVFQKNNFPYATHSVFTHNTYVKCTTSAAINTQHFHHILRINKNLAVRCLFLEICLLLKLIKYSPNGWLLVPNIMEWNINVATSQWVNCTYAHTYTPHMRKMFPMDIYEKPLE